MGNNGLGEARNNGTQPSNRNQIPKSHLNQEKTIVDEHEHVMMIVTHEWIAAVTGGSDDIISIMYHLHRHRHSTSILP